MKIIYFFFIPFTSLMILASEVHELTVYVGSENYWSGTANGIGTNSLFNGPSDLDISSNDKFALITDSNNKQIRHVDLSNGNVTLFAGSPTKVIGFTNGIGTNSNFKSLQGIAISPDDSFALVIDQHQIRQIILSTVSVDIFSGSETFGYINDIGTSATFQSPHSLDIHPDGSYALIADSGNRVVRQLDLSTRTVTTFVGTRDVSYNFPTDGIGSNCKFDSVLGLSISPDGLFAVLVEPNANRVRQIILSTLSVTTLAGYPTIGHADGIGTFATFRNPYGISISPDGLFAVLTDNQNYLIRLIDLRTLSVITVAGKLAPPPPPDDSPWDDDYFKYFEPLIYEPRGIRYLQNGNALFVDSSNSIIRHVDLVTTYSPTSAPSHHPTRMHVTTPPTFGSLSVLVGSFQYGPTNGIGTNVKFKQPYDIAISSSSYSSSKEGSGGAVSSDEFALIVEYFSHSIRYLNISTNTVTQYVGGGEKLNGYGTNVRIFLPVMISISSNGQYALVTARDHLIRRITLSTKYVEVYLGTLDTPQCQDGIGTSSTFNSPVGITISSDSTFALIADTENGMIRHVDLSTTQVTTIAGNKPNCKLIYELGIYSDGIGTNSGFVYPVGITISPDNSYALVTDVNRIRQIILSTKSVTTIAGCFL
jgi:hypothetical protein